MKLTLSFSRAKMKTYFMPSLCESLELAPAIPYQWQMVPLNHDSTLRNRKLLRCVLFGFKNFKQRKTKKVHAEA